MIKELHQSQIRNFFKCEKAFELGLKHPIAQTPAMKDGLLFETYLFGAKDGTEKEDAINDILQIKLKKDGTPYAMSPAQKEKLARISSYAAITEAKFGLDGTPFVKLESEYKGVKLAGEADFIGRITYLGDRIFAIVDTKFTGSIERIWTHKNAKPDFLQAVMYNFLAKEQGVIPEYVPFIYIVVENNTFDRPLIKTFKLNVTEEAVNWLKSMIDEILLIDKAGLHYTPTPDLSKCLRCNYLQYCYGGGRELIEEPIEIDFDNLADIEE